MARRKKTDEVPKENQDKIDNNSDDTFGLPEVQYEPLKRDQGEPPPEVPSEPVIEEPVFDTTEEPVYERTNEPVEETPPPPVFREEIVDHHEETIDHPEETVHHQDEELHHEYSQHYSYREPESPMWPKVLAIALLLLLAGGAIYYFAVYKPEQKALAAREIARENAAAKAAEEKRRAAAAEKVRADAEQRRLDSLANVPKIGTMEVLSRRTGQYYIVVASAIDDDLLTDFANKLVSEGKSVKLIPPFGRSGKFYRLAIESKDNYNDAQAAADGMKGGDFGDQLWVVRY